MIDILLSTYNGERFIRDFIASLERQTCRDFRLVIRDDGSDDATVAVVRDAVEKAGFRSVFPTSPDRHLGVVKSFGKLLENSSGRYVMFADQDDLWHPDKIAEMLKLMREAEARWGEDTPLLLHTDLRVCDDRGATVADSFIRYQRLTPGDGRLLRLLIQNSVTGCAMMFNHALKTRIRQPLPDEAVCHDWYLALLAAAVGRIVFSDRALVDYRQHEDNVFGARRYCPAEWFERFRLGRETLRHRLVLTQLQARAFLRQYGDVLTPADRETVGLWAEIGTLPKRKRIAACVRCGFRKSTLFRNIGMWWAI